MWLLPELDKNGNWQEDSGVQVVALPSESFERIEVCHIGANGQVVGPREDRFVNGNVRGLLDAWLNPTKSDPVEFLPMPSGATLEVPTVSGDEVIYKQRTIPLAPYGVLPIDSLHKESGEFTARWPPESSHLKTISPDAESQELHGPFELRFTDNGLPTAVSDK